MASEQRTDCLRVLNVTFRASHTLGCDRFRLLQRIGFMTRGGLRARAADEEKWYHGLTARLLDSSDRSCEEGGLFFANKQRSIEHTNMAASESAYE
mgnify:CR=1 FL=1